MGAVDAGKVTQAGLYGQALALARESPCDPKTLARAARDFCRQEPEFAVEAGVLAIHWLVEGYGYEITNGDVWDAYTWTMAAATQAGRADEARERIRVMVAAETFGERFVTKVLGAEIGAGRHPRSVRGA